MKCALAKVLLCGTWLVLVAAAAGAEELTAESILTMHRSGAPADIIVTRVDSPANTLAITTRDLVTLRHAGVPESVLTAMRAHIPASPATVPLQPDDARLVDLVHLIGTGISESIISEQVRQSDQTYVLSVNDIRYLEEHGAGDRTIAALMATRAAGRPLRAGFPGPRADEQRVLET